jgi:hypothetical protein
VLRNTCSILIFVLNFLLLILVDAERFFVKISSTSLICENPTVVFSTGMSFFSYLVEDKVPVGGLSYVEFLVHIHRQIQVKMSS